MNNLYCTSILIYFRSFSYVFQKDFPFLLYNVRNKCCSSRCFCLLFDFLVEFYSNFFVATSFLLFRLLLSCRYYISIPAKSVSSVSLRFIDSTVLFFVLGGWKCVYIASLSVVNCWFFFLEMYLCPDILGECYQRDVSSMWLKVFTHSVLLDKNRIKSMIQRAI